MATSSAVTICSTTKVVWIRICALPPTPTSPLASDTRMAGKSWLVMLSVLELPVSEAGARLGTSGIDGATVSTVTTRASLDSLSTPPVLMNCWRML